MLQERGEDAFTSFRRFGQSQWSVPHNSLLVLKACNGIQVCIFLSLLLGSYGNQYHSPSQVNAETAAVFISERYAHFLYWPDVPSTYTSRQTVEVLHALGNPALYFTGVIAALSGCIFQAIVGHTCQIFLVKLIYVHGNVQLSSVVQQHTLTWLHPLRPPHTLPLSCVASKVTTAEHLWCWDRVKCT